MLSSQSYLLVNKDTLNLNYELMEGKLLILQKMVFFITTFEKRKRNS